MKLRSGAIVSVVIAALALASTLVVVLTRNRPTTDETRARSRNLLSVWREREITRFAVGGAAPLVLAREGEDWFLKQPLSERADQDAVRELLATLGFAAPARAASGPAAALGIGAESPKLSIEAGDVQYELRLGKSAEPPAGGAYVEVVARGAPGGGLFVVPKETVALFQTKVDDLRARALFPFGEHALSSLELVTPGRRVKLEHGAGPGWKLDDGKRANRAPLEALFHALAGLELEHFLERREAEAVLASAQTSLLRAVPKQGAPLELLFGGACPRDAELVTVLDKRQGGKAGCSERAILERLAIAPDALVDRFPFAARPDEVEELSIERDGKRLTLTRKGSGFLLRQPSEAEVSADAGNARVTAIVRAPAEVVTSPDRKKLGLEPAAGKVKVVSPVDGKAVEEVVEIGRPAPDGTLHLARPDGVVLALGRDAARAFDVDTTLLKSPRLLDFAQSDLASVRLTSPEPQELRRTPGGALELVTPKGHRVDDSSMTELVFALGSLTATRWVADRDDGSFGFTRPKNQVTIEFEAGDAGSKRRTLLVGSPVPGGYYARFEDDPPVFVLERETVDKLGELLIDRTPFSIDPKSIQRIELEHEGKRLLVAESAGELRALGPAELSRAEVATLVQALGDVHADAALHTGKARPEEGFERPALTVRVERRTGAPVEFQVGAADEYRGVSVFFARAKGVDATFVIARSVLRPLLDLF